MNLFICADPGARSQTLASWLSDELSEATFEPGIKFPTRFHKAHTDFGNHLVKNHIGPKIRIRTGYKKLATHMYLFLIKNVYTQIPDFSRNQFDLETATKMVESAKYWFDHDRQVDNDCYDHIINFEDTFDIEMMISLYSKIRDRSPSLESVETLKQTNKLNDPVLDKNHACEIAAMVLEKEKLLGLKEEERFWSFPDLYQVTSVDQLYDTISSRIVPDNYGIDLNKL